MNKKGAIELSIGTIVVIVLAMSMLILGLVLIKNIFGGATATVDVLNDKVMGAVSSLFSDEGTDVVVKLGSDQTAKITSGTANFGIAIGARLSTGDKLAGRDHLKYKLSLEPATGKNCVSPAVLGPTKTKALFLTCLDPALNPFDQYDGSNAYAKIQLTIPKGTPACTQKVLVDVINSKDNNSPVGGNYFVIEVLKSGIFS